MYPTFPIVELELKVKALMFNIQCLWFRIQGVWFKVWIFKILNTLENLGFNQN